MKIEIRADNSVHIEGYVNAVERDSNIINVPSVGRCVEQIRAGAFGRALGSGADVAILENHDTARKLGSTSQGNLKLCEDNIGLRASADITDADIAGKARRGELKGWSFGFICTDSEIEQRAGNVPRRIVKGMTLSEVSLIDGDYRPCYNGTLVEVRSEGNFMEYRSCEDEATEIIVEERAEEIDYSYYDALLRYCELRYNPYHDPGNGRFCSGGGGSGGGGVLVVPKGQKGHGYYGAIDTQQGEDALANEFEEWVKSRNTGLTKSESGATIESEEYGNMSRIIGCFEKAGVKYNPVKPLDAPLSEEEIINRVGGGDLTKGSCASLSLAYAANKAGYDVRDFRGGVSRATMADKTNYADMIHGVESMDGGFFLTKGRSKAIEYMKDNMQDGKEYIFSAGKHSAIVRKNGKNLEYLELQRDPAGAKFYEDGKGNGWKPLNCDKLGKRFGCDKSYVKFDFASIEDVSKSTGFKNLMGYINTPESEQQKGSGGYTK